MWRDAWEAWKEAVWVEWEPQAVSVPSEADESGKASERLHVPSPLCSCEISEPRNPGP